MTMTHTMSTDLLSSQNESWGDAVGTFGVESLHITAEPAKAASSLDDYLQNHSPISGFELSIPSHPLPTDVPFHNEQKNEDGSCDQSVVSDLTQMTYRAELMKQAIAIEFEKFRQQKKQQGVDAPPKAIATMFARKMSCPDIQQSVTSFVNTTSAEMKAEARQNDNWEEQVVVKEDDATSDPTMIKRVDELFVEFGVRPARPIPYAYEPPEENSNITRTRSSYEQDAVADHHLDSIIQLKLQLAQKQAAYDELSSKYVAMMLKNSGQQKLETENSSLRRENERLRAQLRQGGMRSSFSSRQAGIRSSFSSSFNSSGSSKPKLALSFFQQPQRAEVDMKNAVATTPPLSLQQSTGSFSNMIQGWRNRAA